MSNTKKVALLIMDGWGKAIDKNRSAISVAKTPNVDAYYQKYPNSDLVTFGGNVGLPEGQMGNSEVGHMNLGAGRVVYQELARINKAIEDNSLASNEQLNKTFEYCKSNNRPLHLMGLVSDGGVHSHVNHLIALCKYAHEFGIQNIFVHAFTDGRDCAPKSGLSFIELLEKSTESYNVKIASVIGRYYAMDRDNRWERIKLAYDLLLQGKGDKYFTATDAITTSYKANVTDEFVEPKVIVDENDSPIAKIEADDAVLCFNFRTDRCREISVALTQKDIIEQKMQAVNLHYTTMTRYDETFKNINVLFEKDDLKNTLGEVLAKNGKTQLRIAETEKYPHVTFFFSGGREQNFEGENRIVIPSPKVATYDLQPEMSALKIKEAVLEEIENKQPDFICLNFANTDMVGHTGIFEAAVKAAETVDTCIGEIVEKVLEKDYTILLTADHGNADIMQNEDGTPHTAHTKNLVPLFLITNENKTTIKDGKLGDIAPTVLNLMRIEIPNEMTGEILVES